MRIDLDAARAARREASGEAPTIIFQGQEFVLEPELPFSLAEQLAEMQTSDAKSQAEAARTVIKILLNGSHDAFMALNPSIADVTVLVDELLKVYGAGGLGESEASAVSS